MASTRAPPTRQPNLMPGVVVNRDDMPMMPTPLQKSYSLELIRNCDLPPPAKVVYAGLMGRGPYDDERPRSGEDHKMERLLRALHLSQTRARETEKRATAILDALFKESMNSSAYRNWVRLLELEVSELKSKLEKQGLESCHGGCQCSSGRSRDCGKKDDEQEQSPRGVVWILALAIPLSIGLAFASKYLI